MNGNTLIHAGFKPGKNFKLLLARAQELDRAGIDYETIFEQLTVEFPAPPPKIHLAATGSTLTEAITPITDIEITNLEKVRITMNELLRVPVVYAGALMPDTCPAGSEAATIPVGGAIKVHNAIIPGAHSADVCCSMFATFYSSNVPIQQELETLRSVTRFGPGGRHPDNRVHHPVLLEKVWDNRFLKGLEELAAKHISDQGDGNHFAYIGEVMVDSEMTSNLLDAGYDYLAKTLQIGKLYRVLVTHHGSRGLGAAVYKRGKEVAIKMTAEIAEGIPDQGAWIPFDTDAGQEYWEALQYCSRWTVANHRSIHERFLKAGGNLEASISLGNEHNFVWKRGEYFYHGKGATPAWNDEYDRPKLGLIPLNMSEPILLVLGSNNEKFLSFAPHGAGRNLSRTELKKGMTESEEVSIDKSTDGIHVLWYSGVPDISETPIAYKNAVTVRSQIEDFGLARVVAEIMPLGCIMAGHIEPHWKKKKGENSRKD